MKVLGWTTNNSKCLIFPKNSNVIIAQVIHAPPLSERMVAVFYGQFINN